jgi:hypothetical protein
MLIEGDRGQIAPERFDVGTLCLSVHRDCNEPSNVEPDVDEVWVLS